MTFKLLLLVSFLSIFYRYHVTLATPERICQSKFADWLTDHIAENEGRSSWGVSIMEQSPTSNINNGFSFHHGAKQYFQPASTNKVLTTVASLVSLGASHRFQTRIMLGNDSLLQDLKTSSNGDNKHDKLRIVMTGDPSLSSRALYDRLKKLSLIGTIDTVELDISAFTDGTPPMPDSWEFGDLAYDFGAQPTCAVLDHNFVKFRVLPGQKIGDPLRVLQLNTEGTDVTPWYSVPVLGLENTVTLGNEQPIVQSPQLYYRPGESAIRVTSQSQMRLNASSIDIVRSLMQPEEFIASTIARMVGATRTRIVTDSTESDYARYVTLDTIVSEPLPVLMNWTLLESDNMYTELFLRQLGYYASSMGSNKNNKNHFHGGFNRLSGKIPVDVEQLGLKQVRSILVDKLGVSGDAFRQVDGSGLSRHNLLSPQGLIETIVKLHEADRSLFRLYLSLLPVGGVSGTLKNRFLDYPGVVRAKTGSMTGVISLAGLVDSKYIVSHGRGPYVFAFIVNQSAATSADIRKAIDTAVIALHLMDPSC